jgi:uncharacterized membrane protein HdeD (DUF308 family)
MNPTTKNMPWWLVVFTGVLIIAVGIFLLAANGANLADPNAVSVALKTLIYIVGIGVLLYGLYCLFKAIQFKNDNRISLPYLVHGILDIVLFLLLLIIHPSAGLLGVILSSWMIVFGIFGMIQGRQETSSRKTRAGVLLTLIGLCFLIIPLLFSFNHVDVLGVIALVLGVFRTAQGIISKVKLDGRTSGGRSNIY